MNEKEWRCSDANNTQGHLWGWKRDATPPRVLIAADDDAMRDLLIDTMRDSSFEVTAVKNSTETIDKTILDTLDPKRSSVFDVLVLDISMSGFTGLEVVESLRERRLRPAVIVISSFVDDQMYEEAERFGCVTIFKKPFSLGRLIYTVETASCWVRLKHAVRFQNENEIEPVVR